MKILTQLVPLASTLVIGSALNADPGLTATLNFQEATEGLLKFRDDTGTQIGSGSFEYSPDPIEGTFVYGSGGFYFATDPSQIPEEYFPPRQTISVSADQDLRLVTNTSINILGAAFENQRTDLSSGPFGGEVLLFQPTQNTFFPPGPGGPFSVSPGDPRYPGLFFGNRWFLGNTGANPQQQLSIDSDGDFVGFDLSLVPSEEMPSSNFSGKWEAEAVPEPFTTLGTAAALGLGYHLQNKGKRHLKAKEKAKA